MENTQTSVLMETFIAHRPELLGCLTNLLHSHGDAEDVVQETCLRLLRSDTGEQVAFPKAYIFRIARNLAFDLLRRNKRFEATLSTIVVEAAPDPASAGPEDKLIAEEQTALIQEAVSQLPARCHQVYTLRSKRDLSHTEIAGRLNISVRTVENHIARATKNCREYLESNWT